MDPLPDPRWRTFIGGISPAGMPAPMSFEVLHRRALSLTGLVPARFNASGPASLLRTARSLLEHAWLNYDFLAVACSVSLQAVEAAVRLHYPKDDKVPFKALVNRAIGTGILPGDSGPQILAGVELRNRMAHPGLQSAFTFGMATPVLVQSHRLVSLLLEALPKDGQST